MQEYITIDLEYPRYQSPTLDRLLKEYKDASAMRAAVDNHGTMEQFNAASLQERAAFWAMAESYCAAARVAVEKERKF